MGFCTEAQRRRFLEVCPEFELFIVDDGSLLIKYWLEVSDEEQKRRFEARIEDPLRQWKLSPMDLCSRSKWFGYSPCCCTARWCRQMARAGAGFRRSAVHGPRNFSSSSACPTRSATPT
jgi:Polyphosphate kinase 2 (PPK2)